MSKKVRKNKGSKKIFRKLLVIGAISYFFVILINQQVSLNSYKTQMRSYQEQIKKEESRKTELNSQRENANSDEFIEQMAREKLNLYLPNERVYIDMGK